MLLADLTVSHKKDVTKGKQVRVSNIRRRPPKNKRLRKRK
jgi:hypothetical protein